ncbi:hypothetical protein BACCIP111899_03481 [Bacillus rhizoplanae]|uniref:Immunity protein SdpI n=1 Tax=Bacillus rhizoplanae TaxID=2880966 RepID=A0ABN8A3S3_9BACI|nr:DUF1648 domain-containing protein [Bacillus rhizoplanae]CAG9614254.1 hypothetical protein BACCIP111899_03481 [Bacillus rhizoplanae]
MKNKFGLIMLCTIITTNIILYFFLPPEVVTKWDFNGNPTSTMTKGTHVTIAILLSCFIAFLFEGLSHTIEDARFFKWIGNAVLLFLFFTDTTLSLLALGYNLPHEQLILSAVGLLFIIIGYFIMKVDAKNSTISYQWNSKRLEKKAQKICGISIILAGVCIVISPFVFPSSLMHYAAFGTIVIMTVVVIGSTIYLFIKDQKQSSSL